MRTHVIVVEAPARDDLPRFGQIQESMLIQAFVPESAVEAFNVSVLHRLARLADNDLGLAPPFFSSKESIRSSPRAEIQLAAVEHGNVAIDSLTRSISDLRLALESVDNATAAEAKALPPPPGFDLDGFIASKRGSLLEKLGLALESLGNATSDDSKLRIAAINFQLWRRAARTAL